MNATPVGFADLPFGEGGLKNRLDDGVTCRLLYKTY
jgi:hypothetical protein